MAQKAKSTDGKVIWITRPQHCVTLSDSTAFLNCVVVAPLDADSWYGISTPCSMLASLPFAVMTRGAETISPRPMLFITGDQAHSREFSEDAFRRAAEPKELLIIPNAGHVDLYDRVNLIPWSKLTAFFALHLGRRPA